MYITVTNDIFGKNLQYLRKKYSLSRMALAKLTGNAAVLIAAWEDCRVYPTLAPDTVERLCTIFQVTSQALLLEPMATRQEQ